MINEKKILCIIPARSGSKGLPGKNIRELAGKPLLTWPIHAAQNSQYVDKILVSTDCEKIATIAKKNGAEVPYLRPPYLALDNSPSYSLIEDLLNNLSETFDYVLLLEPTSPLTDSYDIDKAIDMLDSSSMNFDSIVGITKEEKSHPSYLIRSSSKGCLSSYIEEGFEHPIRRQDLSPLYRMEGSLYLSKTASLKNYQSFYQKRTLGYEVPEWKSMEIDSIVDFICIEAIINKKEMIENE